MFTNNSGQPYRVNYATSRHWYEIWFQLFFRPSRDRIAEFVQIPDRDPKVPSKWLFISSAIGWTISYIPNTIYQGTFKIQYLIIGPVLFGLLWMFTIGLYVALTQYLVERFMGGEGTSRDLMYVYAGMISPARLMVGFVELIGVLIPWIRYLGTIIWVYELVLLGFATKTINRITWLQALVAIIPIFAIGICDLYY